MFWRAIPFEGKSQPVEKIFEVNSLSDFRKKKSIQLITDLQENLNYLLKSLDEVRCGMDRLREIEAQLIRTLPVVEAQRIRCVIGKANKYKMHKSGKDYLIS